MFTIIKKKIRRAFKMCLRRRLEALCQIKFLSHLFLALIIFLSFKKVICGTLNLKIHNFNIFQTKVNSILNENFLSKKLTQIFIFFYCRP